MPDTPYTSDHESDSDEKNTNKNIQKKRINPIKVAWNEADNTKNSTSDTKSAKLGSFHENTHRVMDDAKFDELIKGLEAQKIEEQTLSHQATTHTPMSDADFDAYIKGLQTQKVEQQESPQVITHTPIDDTAFMALIQQIKAEKEQKHEVSLFDTIDSNSVSDALHIIHRIDLNQLERAQKRLSTQSKNYLDQAKLYEDYNNIKQSSAYKKKADQLNSASTDISRLIDDYKKKDKHPLDTRNAEYLWDQLKKHGNPDVKKAFSKIEKAVEKKEKGKESSSLNPPDLSKKEVKAFLKNQKQRLLEKLEYSSLQENDSETEQESIEIQQYPKEGDRIKLFYPITHVTDKGNLIVGRPWAEAWSKQDPSNPQDYTKKLYFSSEEENKELEKYEGRVTMYKPSSPDSDCFGWLCTKDGVGGWLTEEDIATILNDNDYRPIAGWSRNGNHPKTGWNSKIDYSPITASDDDPIIHSNKLDRPKYPEQAQKDDLVIWFKQTTDGNWLLSHGDTVRESSNIPATKKDVDIFNRGKWGLLGVYDRPLPTGPSAYGDACIIYHTDRPGGRFLKMARLEDSEEMDILLDNKCHTIGRFNSSSSTFLEKSQPGDIAAYYTYNKHTQEWSSVLTASISRLGADGQLYVNIKYRKSDKPREHVASIPGFPYKTAIVYRID